MTLPLNIFLNYLFSSKHDLNDELGITILINQRISGCATDTNLSTEFNVGGDIYCYNDYLTMLQYCYCQNVK